MGYSEAFTLRTNRKVWETAFAGGTGTDVLTANVLTTAPTGGGVVPCTTANVAKILAFGDGAADQTFITRVYGYSPTADSTGYVPAFICKLTWTLGAKTGVDNTPVTSAYNFADEVLLNDGDTSIRLITDTSGEIASVTVDLEGASHLFIAFDAVGSVAGMNALVGLF